MIIYCLLYPILTMTFLMLWVFQSTLPGKVIGMAPFLVGIALIIVFVIELILIQIFRKHIKSLFSKIITLVIAFFLYECTMWLLGGNIVLFGAFQKPLIENTDGAFSFSSIFALIIILGLILINKKITAKNVAQQNL